VRNGLPALVSLLGLEQARFVVRENPSGA